MGAFSPSRHGALGGSGTAGQWSARPSATSKALQAACSAAAMTQAASSAVVVAPLQSKRLAITWEVVHFLVIPAVALVSALPSEVLAATPASIPTATSLLLHAGGAGLSGLPVSPFSALLLALLASAAHRFATAPSCLIASAWQAAPVRSALFRRMVGVSPSTISAASRGSSMPAAFTVIGSVYARGGSSSASLHFVVAVRRVLACASLTLPFRSPPKHPAAEACLPPATSATQLASSAFWALMTPARFLLMVRMQACWALVSGSQKPSSVQNRPQPSPSTVLPSSHSSRQPLIPSPQTSGSQLQSAAQPSPGVVLPSSQASVPGVSTPLPQISKRQLGSQPSPMTVLASSHCSPGCVVPSPHSLRAWAAQGPEARRAMPVASTTRRSLDPSASGIFAILRSPRPEKKRARQVSLPGASEGGGPPRYPGRSLQERATGPSGRSGRWRPTARRRCTPLPWPPRGRTP